MGCESSMCTDTSELILSHHLNGKLSDIAASASDKSTNISSISLNHQEPVPDSVKKFYLIKSLVETLLKDLPNISTLLVLTETWIQELAKIMDEHSMTPDDLKTYLFLDSAGKSIVIRHELDGLRNFNLMRIFSEKVLGSSKALVKDFQKKEKFLLGLCPLTVCFYIKLAVEIDFGFGVEKPIDRKQMTQFLSACEEGGNIGKWTTLNNQPIPTSLWVSALNSSRFLNFYIFDGLKNQNIDKGFSLFEEFGALVPGEILELFKVSKADEVNCVLEFDELSVKSISIRIQTPDLCEHFLSSVDSSTDIEKWNIFHSIIPSKFVSFELNSNGFNFNKVSIL